MCVENSINQKAHTMTTFIYWSGEKHRILLAAPCARRMLSSSSEESVAADNRDNTIQYFNGWLFTLLALILMMTMLNSSTHSLLKTIHTSAAFGHTHSTQHFWSRLILLFNFRFQLLTTNYANFHCMSHSKKSLQSSEWNHDCGKLAKNSKYTAYIKFLTVERMFLKHFEGTSKKYARILNCR